MKKSFLVLLIMLLLSAIDSKACTNFLVTKGASADGSTFITYAADSHIRYGELYYTAARQWPATAMRTIYDRGTNAPRGKIPQIAQTYQVVGYINENQVALGETTFGGREELIDTTGLIDYGSLMFIALERSSTAREAIKIMADLVEEYGYGSDGETFSISDPNEVWYMELIGKGNDMKKDSNGKLYNADRGAVWVAIRIPDGYVSAHANQARITTFPMRDGVKSITDKDWDKLYDKDVEIIYKSEIVSFARSKGYFEGSDEEFDFSAAFAPIDFSGARICDLRVWMMFNAINDDMAKYWDYASGKDLTAERMPLYVKPNRKITLDDMMGFMRNHFQDTELDKSQGYGAGPFGSPYRWMPLYWEYEGEKYFHERPTSTQQTGFSFIAQCRSWLPNIIGGIIWFGVDDTNSTVYTPFYCSITRVPEPFKAGNGDILSYSDSAAFWIFNRVAHFKYLFYDRVIHDIIRLQRELEHDYQQKVLENDMKALSLLAMDRQSAIRAITQFSISAGNNTFRRWKELDQHLLVKFLDGNVKQEDKDGNFLRNPYGYPVRPQQPGYPDEWKKKVIEENPERFKCK